jgi:transposase
VFSKKTCEKLRNVMNNNREHRHLSEIGVVKLVTLLQEGHSQQEVARRLGVSQSVVSRAWRRYRETGIYHRRQGQGRKRKTTYAEDRLLGISAKRKRFCTARELKNDLQLATGTTVSTDTIRRRLSEAELKPYRPATGPVLTAAHRRARFQFTHRHADLQIEDWRHVLFTDESRFCLSTNDRRRREFGGDQVNDLFNMPYKKWNGLVVDQLWFGVESLLRIVPTWWL